MKPASGIPWRRDVPKAIVHDNSDSVVKRGTREISTTACDSWRQPPQPHRFAASHGSVRCRETRQHRSRALAIAVCVTARAPRLVTHILLALKPTAIAVGCRKSAPPALDANRLFDVVILQKCLVLKSSARSIAIFFDCQLLMKRAEGTSLRPDRIIYSEEFR